MSEDKETIWEFIRELVVDVWRYFVPVWTLQWCVIKPIGSDFEWCPKKCWMRNGEADMRYAFFFVLPANDEQEAIRVAGEFNAVDDSRRKKVA